MERFIRIKNSRWVPGSNTRMIHEDQRGDRFIGPPIAAEVDETVIVEVADSLTRNGEYQIIKVIKVIAPTRKKES